MVYKVADRRVRLTSIPVLAVEVLSTNRRDDLVSKMAHYATAGLDHYWVVDRREREVLAYRRTGTNYEHIQTVGAEPADVDFGIASVRIDVDELLEWPMAT